MAKDVNININVDGSEADKTLGGLKNNLEGANTKAQSLKAELRQLTNELMNMEPGSEQFDKMNARAGALKDQIADTQAVIKATAGGPVENLGKGLSTATSIGLRGFQGLQSASALFGSESKNLEKTLVKLQAVAGLADAVESLGGMKDQIVQLKASFGSFFTAAKAGLQGVKGAVAATGIGLLVIALGVLVAYWDDLKTAVSGVSDEQEKQLKMAKDNADTEKNKLDALDKQTNQLKLQGKSERQILEMKIKQGDVAIMAQEAAIKEAKVRNESQQKAAERNYEITKGILTFIQAPLMMILKTIDEVANFAGFDSNLAGGLLDWEASFIVDPKAIKAENDKGIAEMEKQLNELKEQQAGYKLQIKEMDKQAAADKKKKAEEALADAKEDAEKQKKLQREIRDAEIALMEDGKAKEEEIVKENYKRQIEDAGKNTELIKLLKEQEGNELSAIDEKWRLKGLEDAKIARDAKVSLMEEGIQKQSLILQYAYDDEKSKLDEQLKKKQITQESYDASILAAEKKKNDGITKLTEDAEKEKRAIKDKFDALSPDSIEKQKMLIQQQHDDELASFKKLYEDKKITLDEYNAAKEQLDKNAAQKELDLRLDTHQKNLQFAQDFTGAMNGLSDAIFAVKSRNLKKGSKEEEDMMRKQFKVNKAFQLSTAIITGIMSVMSAYQNGMKNPVPLLGPATGAIYAAMAGITSAANIAKIAATKFEGGSFSADSGTGGGSTPDAGGVGAGSAAQTFTPAQFFGLGGGAVQPALTNGGPTKVFVTETDITSTQNRVRVIEDRSKIK